MLAGPLLGKIQALGCHGRVTWNELDLELPWDGNQSCLELVVLDVVSVWGTLLTRDDLVGQQNPH